MLRPGAWVRPPGRTAGAAGALGEAGGDASPPPCPCPALRPQADLTVPSLSFYVDLGRRGLWVRWCHTATVRVRVAGSGGQRVSASLGVLRAGEALLVPCTQPCPCESSSFSQRPRLIQTVP